MTLNVQLLTMGSMIVSGIYLGLAFETYRRVTSWWQGQIVLKYLCDGLFSIIQTAVVFYVLYQVNDGQLRFYIFLACLLGFSIYQVCFKRFYIWILNKVIWLVSIICYSIFQVINQLIFKPIFLLIKFLYNILTYVLNGFVILLKKMFLFIYSYFPPSWIEKKSQIKRKYSIIKNTLYARWKKLFKKGGND